MLNLSTSYDSLRFCIEQGMAGAVGARLAQWPALANVWIRFGPHNQHLVHPIHYVCDGVFEQKYTEAEGLDMVEALLAHGSELNGGEIPPGQDTPLIAAASLLTDRIACLLLDQGAALGHHGTLGGTALHWAAWTGGLSVVARMLAQGPDLEDRANQFQATPLHWAIHGWRQAKGRNLRQQAEVIRLLIAAGASLDSPDAEGLTPRTSLMQTEAGQTLLDAT